MIKFSYQACDQQGDEVTGVVKANSQTEAMERLSLQGLTVYQIRDGFHEDKSLKNTVSFAKVKELTDAERVEICDGLSRLLASGMSLDQALTLLEVTVSFHKPRRILLRVREGFSRGLPVSEAFAEVSDQLGPELTMMIRAGVAANRLKDVLASASEYFSQRTKVKKQIVSAIAYPIFLIISALLVFVAMIFFLIPTLERSMPEHSGGVITTLSHFRVLWLENSIWIYPSAGILIATCVSFRKAVVQLMLNKIPELRSIYLLRQYAGAANLLSIFLKSNVNLTVALGEVESSIASHMISNEFSTAAAKLTKGQRAFLAFEESEYVPVVFRDLFKAGELSNTLDQNMGVAAGFLDEMYQHRRDRLIGLLVPALTLVVGGLIAGLVILMISAILEVGLIAI